MKRLQVIDLFAGPGGLGEGFAGYKDPSGHQPFRLAVSIEKEPWAHQTLLLRAAFRSLEDPRARRRFLSHLASSGVAGVKETFSAQFDEAGREAICAELGKTPRTEVQDAIRSRLSLMRPSILIGGPPCQAYSVAGRVRNKAVQGYEFEQDERHALYQRYLEVITDHWPVAFVMENVKGLLSATTRTGRLFERIRSDLTDPARALGTKSGYRYHMVALSTPRDLFAEKPVDFIVRSEEFGVPQRRHRLIVVGLREDLGAEASATLQRCESVAAGSVISDLPKVRSGLSQQKDSLDRWLAVVREASSSGWLRDLRSLDPDVAGQVERGLDRLVHRDRGGEVVRSHAAPEALERWYLSDDPGVVFNHSTRSHIGADLHRYLFVSSYGRVHRCSPGLSDFPKALLPHHENAQFAVQTGSMFSDRFRVQLRDTPSTTVTSHISKDGHYFIHHDPRQCRSLTVREAARLQTFPDSYFFCGPRTSQYTQVGNAVPPYLAYQIAGALYSTLKGAGVF